MKKIMLLGAMLCYGLGLWAQAPKKLEEVRDTLRFIRLAETKKQLPFDDETLLEINAILDEIEERRFDLMAREMNLHRRTKLPDLSEEEAGQVLDELQSIKKQTLENEMALWSRIREVLQPKEAMQFFTFYGKFTREIQRRIRMLQQQGKNRRDRPGGRFRNQNRPH